MNTIKIKDKGMYTTIFKLLRQAERGDKETAFIGRIIGHTSETNETVNNLYLITYDTIVRLNSPRKTWNSSSCEVFVEQFVDLEIKVINKE